MSQVFPRADGLRTAGWGEAISNRILKRKGVEIRLHCAHLPYETTCHVVGLVEVKYST